MARCAEDELMGGAQPMSGTGRSGLGSGAPKEALMSLDQREALYKLSRNVKNSFHPASMGSSNNTEDRGDWLFKKSNAGCAGL